MGFQIKADHDSNTKPNYLVTLPPADAIPVADGEFSIYIGGNVPAQVEANSGIMQCTQGLRESDWPDPGVGNVNIAIYDMVSRTLTVQLDVTIPAITENDCAVIHSSGFTKSADSNSAHCRRMLELYMEVVKRAEILLPASQRLGAFYDVGGAFVPDVVIGTGPAAEARASAVLRPASPVYETIAANEIPVITARGQDWIWTWPSMENECLQSNNMSIAPWSLVDVTAFADQDGVDGAANGATRIVGTGTNIVEYSSQQFNFTGVARWITIGFHVRKSDVPLDRDDDYFPGIGVSTQGGLGSPSGNFMVDNWNGETISQTGIGTTRIITLDEGDWYRVLVGVYVLNSTTGLSFFVYPAGVWTGGIFYVPQAGENVFTQAFFYDGLSPEQVAGSPVNPTAAAPVTLEASKVTIPIANHDNAQGVYFADILFFDQDEEDDSVYSTPIIAVGATAPGEVLSFERLDADSSRWTSEDQAGEVASGAIQQGAGPHRPFVGYSALQDVHAVTIAEGTPPQGSYTAFTVDTDIAIGGLAGRPAMIRNVQGYNIEGA